MVAIEPLRLKQAQVRLEVCFSDFAARRKITQLVYIKELAGFLTPWR